MHVEQLGLVTEGVTSRRAIGTLRRWLVSTLAAVLAACAGESGSGSMSGKPGVSVLPPSSAGSASGDFGNTAQQPNASTGASGVGAMPVVRPTDCARATVGVTRLIPTVEVVIDASGSMVDAFPGCTTRWECLRDALIGEQGLITSLQGTVRFGLTLYGGQIARVENGMVVETIDATCPRYLRLAPALDHRDAIAAPYERANPAGGTPTAEALAPIIDALPDVTRAIDEQLGPQIILLVTDGDPNTCAEPAHSDYGPTEAEAQRAQDKHIQLFVITVADDQDLAHLQRMANLGAGLRADALPGAPYFQPGSADDLTRTLLDIVGGAIGCEVKLEGKVKEGDECRGEVALNGDALPCNGADGWRLLDPSTIELQGAACERFKFDESVMVNAAFPCDLLEVE
jgi:hypothetical protein